MVSKDPFVHAATRIGELRSFGRGCPLRRRAVAVQRRDRNTQDARDIFGRGAIGEEFCRRLQLFSGQQPRTTADGPRRRERNGSLRSAICGALYSIAPSALLTRPVRLPVAIACARRRPTGIVIASQCILGFALQCLFDDQPRSEAHELRTPGRPRPRSDLPSTPSASRVSARMRVSSPSGCSFVEAGRLTRPR